MLFNIEFWNMEKYLPTKRHRNLRERYVKNSVDVEIKEVTEKEFPVAFIVHDYQSVYENAKSYSDFNGNGDYRMFSEEIRVYNGNLYMPVRVTHGAAISLYFEPLEYIKKQIEEYAPYWKGGEEFTEMSIIKEDNITECKEKIFRKVEDYIIYDGKVWKTCGEPMYNITTFGLGYNHGGTGFFIQYHYNENISNKNYFNALEREKAIAYGKKVAASRGDTKSVDGMGNHDIIEVLMPEMVRRNPQKEHEEGDAFLNSLENMISGTDSSMEAGLLTVTMCMAGMKG
ncbi:MAG: hypothetical protein HDQ99_02595 [Lachnospiraceae bacterium]|nr:hypothetical protein [Lachnospiraceae bacterium]